MSLHDLRETRLLPNGVDLLGAVQQNVVDNLLDGQAPIIDFPSVWRLAKLVTSEAAPLVHYRYDLDL